MTQEVIPGMEQIARREDSPTAIMRLIERGASDPAFDAHKLTALYDLYERAQRNESRLRFEAAFEQFKRNLPEIFKTKKVEIPTRDGKPMVYSHAELDKITPILTESLLSHGITHYWKTGAVDGKITVTCVLRGYGHTEDAATLPGAPDTSGSKSGGQAIGSIVSFLERYTLCAACGIAPKGMDDDARTDAMPEDSVLDYIAAMKDASELPGLMKIAKECVDKANYLKDTSAKERFRKVYEECKRALREMKQ